MNEKICQYQQHNNFTQYSLNIGQIENSEIYILTYNILHIFNIINKNKNHIDPSTGEKWDFNLYFEYKGNTDNYGHFDLKITGESKVLIMLKEGYDVITKNNNKITYLGIIQDTEHHQCINMFTTLSVYLIKYMKCKNDIDYKLYTKIAMKIIYFNQLESFTNFNDSINIYKNEKAMLTHAKLTFLVLMCKYFFGDNYTILFDILANLIYTENIILYHSISNYTNYTKGTIYDVLKKFISKLNISDTYKPIYIYYFTTSYNNLIALENNPYKTYEILSNLFIVDTELNLFDIPILQTIKNNVDIVIQYVILNKKKNLTFNHLHTILTNAAEITWFKKKNIIPKLELFDQIDNTINKQLFIKETWVTIIKKYQHHQFYGIIPNKLNSCLIKNYEINETKIIIESYNPIPYLFCKDQSIIFHSFQIDIHFLNNIFFIEKIMRETNKLILKINIEDLSDLDQENFKIYIDNIFNKILQYHISIICNFHNNNILINNENNQAQEQATITIDEDNPSPWWKNTSRTEITLHSDLSRVSHVKIISRYTGVIWNIKFEKWVSVLDNNPDTPELFEDEKSAALKYDLKATLLDLPVNFPFYYKLSFVEDLSNKISTDLIKQEDKYLFESDVLKFNSNNTNK